MRKGSHHSKEAKIKISLITAGANNPFYGRKHSKNTRAKMSLAKLGNVNAHGNLGKQHSEETIAKQSLAQIRRFVDPVNHPSWLGGKSSEKYGTRWTPELREQIRDRDGHICQLCNTKEGKRRHPVHHIDYNKKHNWSNNLIELCTGCNIKVNSNRKRWKEYFRWIIVGEYFSPAILLQGEV